MVEQVKREETQLFYNGWMVIKVIIKTQAICYKSQCSYCSK